MSLYENIKAIKPYTTLKWPGTDLSFRLYIANQQILNTAALETEKIFKSINFGIHNVEAYRSEKLFQIIARVVKTEDDKSICTISEFRKLMTPDIFEWLDDEHEALQEKHAPVIDNMSQGEFDKLVEDLKKKPDPTLLDNCSLATLRRVCLHLVSPPQSLTPEI